MISGDSKGLCVYGHISLRAAEGGGDLIFLDLFRRFDTI